MANYSKKPMAGVKVVKVAKPKVMVGKPSNSSKVAPMKKTAVRKSVGGSC
jgi:hypothetical protein